MPYICNKCVLLKCVAMLSYIAMYLPSRVISKLDIHTHSGWLSGHHCPNNNSKLFHTLLVGHSVIVTLTGLPIGYSVTVALTGLPIGYSVIVALTGLPIGYSVIVALIGLPIGYNVIVAQTGLPIGCSVIVALKCLPILRLLSVNFLHYHYGVDKSTKLCINLP